MSDCWTVYHARFSSGEFFDFLIENDIFAIVDARYGAGYLFSDRVNQQVFVKLCEGHSLHYVFLEDAFDSLPSLYQSVSSEDDLLEMMRIPKVKFGLSVALRALKTADKVVILTDEKAPDSIFRSFIIGAYLKKKGHSVFHMKGNDATCTQNELEDDILSRYAPEAAQLSLFDEAPSRDYRLARSFFEKCYKKKV